MINYYKVLEIENLSEAKEVKTAYRKLAKLYHPDINDGNEDKFKQITEAYKVLSSNQKYLYDKDLQAFLNGSHKTLNVFEEFQTNLNSDIFETNDIFDEPKFYNDAPKDSFRNNPYRTKSPYDPDNFNDIKINKPKIVGKNYYTNLEITLLQALFGGNYPFEIKEIVKCPNCMNKAGSCELCNNEKFIFSKSLINLELKPGSKNYQELIVENKGYFGKNGGQRGNMIINLQLKDDSIWKLKDNNLYIEVPISLKEIFKQEHIEIPTPYGNYHLSILPNEVNNLYQIPNYGFYINENKKGDLFVSFKIIMDLNLSEIEAINTLLSTKQTRIKTSVNIRENLFKKSFDEFKILQQHN